MLIEILYLLVILVRYAEACGVGDVADSGSGLCHGIDDTSEILVVGASRILCIELYVFDIAFRIFHSSHRPFDNFLGSGVELISYVAFRCTNACMYALVLGILQRLCSNVNIFLHGACQCAYRGPCHSFADLDDTIEVARAGDRESGFDDIHAERLELLGNLNLLYGVQLASRHLLAVAQRSVKNIQSITHVI